MNYRELESLGAGGYGRVYKVVGEDGKEYAKKVFNSERLLPEAIAEITRRFEREVKFQSHIDHPNVVKIIDSDLSLNPPFYIMELADCTLADELRNPHLAPNTSKALLDILAGLEAIHSKGIKHRDLKPENVLHLQKGQSDDRYAISDFGLMTTEESQLSSLTETNVRGGTPMYAAPECWRNFKTATFASDIYSFGAILHDIYAPGVNRTPFSELTVDGPLKEIVEKCTKRLTKRRYRTVADLRAELFNIIDTAPVSFASREEQDVINLLAQSSNLQDDEWDRVFYLIDDNNKQQVDNYNVFRAISLEHLRQLGENAPELLTAFAEDFCPFVKSGTFNFDYCDVLADKMQIIYDSCELDIQSQVATALLSMGKSHNRWYVMRKFIKMIGSNISNELADRFIIEMQVSEMSFSLVQRVIDTLDEATIDDLHSSIRPFLLSE